VLRKSTVSLVLIFGLHAEATVLPDNLELEEAHDSVNPLDPDLLAWKKSHAEVIPFQELNQEQFQQLLGTVDEVTRSFLKLRYANVSNRKPSEALKEALAMIDSAKQSGEDIAKASPLGPYLLEEILESTSLPPETSQFIERQILRSDVKSCPQRGAIIRAISNDRVKKLDIPEMLELMSRIQQYRSTNFKEEAFQSLLDSMSSEHQEALRTTIQPLVKDFSRLIGDHDWIFGDSQPAQEPRVGSSAAALTLETADRAVRQKQCNKAQTAFEAAIKIDKDKREFDRVESVGRKIETCFRRSGSTARIKFWARVGKPLQDAYGFQGKELALRRQGLVMWSDDNFVQSRKMFSEILELSVAAGDKFAEGNAIYTLARIEENQSKFIESIKFYEEYVKRFPVGDQRENVLTSLVLLKSIVDQHSSALTYAEQIIQEQSLLDVDKRSPSAMSFALFWGGRLHLALGQRENATEMWRRVSTEFYSTFYGAVGHYMLERLTGKSYALQPSRTPKFESQKMFSAFIGEDRHVVDRAELLLRLGLRQDALCEISELDTQDGNSDKLATKSLLMFSAGEWLQAVKLYDALPRSFRNRLPVGFERILFPKAYGDSVISYSESLGVDPDFVLAIIRQESVFNPKAKSIVGASGLMQLMPRTAQAESQRLLRSYLSQEQRNSLRRLAQRDTNLFDAQTNLALGVHHVYRLLEKYKNPVFILTSYNANPGATKRWAENIPTDDFLVFIERIPYQETRQYVKLVLRNYFYYKRWYQKPSTQYPIIDQVLAVDVARLPPKAEPTQNL
jgi:hypothetical protein